MWRGGWAEFSQVSMVGVIFMAKDRQQLTYRARKRVSGPSVMCQHTLIPPPRVRSLSLKALVAKSFVLACNYTRVRLHTLQHDCIFKPPRPCGNFAIWWRLSAALASNRKNIVLGKTKKRGVTTSVLSRENPPQQLNERERLKDDLTKTRIYSQVKLDND